MIKAAFSLAALAALALQSACLGTESEEVTVSCSHISDSSCCSESSTTTPDISRDICTDTDLNIGTPGSFSESSCPSENRVGWCDQTDADNDIHYCSSGGNPYDTSTAEAACGGTFTAE